MGVCRNGCSARRDREVLEVLVPERSIRQRIGELGRRISADYAAARSIHLVGVLRGAFLFLADLCRTLTVPATVDFLAVETYRQGDRAGAKPRLFSDLRDDIAGRHVLLVEDIVDTGGTLHFLYELLARRGPASLRCCTLLDKPSRRRMEVRVEYAGFEIPDVWAVGYGLDDRERYRTLRHIGFRDPGRTGLFRAVVPHGRDRRETVPDLFQVRPQTRRGR
ncbi:MAG: hypoxanthine phosphoribosyltransferase [Deltaproteobacteria bacterium]